METTPNPDFNFQTRVYFLNQGKRIEKLQTILDTNLVTHQLRKWISVLFEIILYILFGLILIAILFFPTSISHYISLNDTQGIDFKFIDNKIRVFLILCKVLLILTDIPLLLFALLLKRNRKKNIRIRQAYNEVNQMKEEFEKAVKELKL